MHIEVRRGELSQAVSKASRVVSTRPSLPILSHVLLEAAPGQISLFATDLELGLLTRVGAKVEEDGRLAVPARPLLEFLSTNTDQIVTLRNEGPHLTMESEHMKVRLTGGVADDFPTPSSPKQSIPLILPASRLAEAAKAVVIAAALEDTRPVLTGVSLRVEGQTLILVATDSFRLAEKQLALQSAPPAFSPFLLPHRTVTELLRLIASEPEVDEVKLTIDEAQCVISIGSSELSSRLIDGVFPNYRDIVPKSFTTDVQLKRADLLNLVKAANVLSRSQGSSVKITFSSDGFVQVRGSEDQLGQVETTMSATVTGETIESAFSARFLLDVLTILPTSDLEIHLNGKTTPAVLSPQGDTSYRYVMMPLRIEG